jgi:hypothetical protein
MKKKLKWYTIDNEEIQAGSLAEAQKIIKKSKAFKNKQRNKEVMK